MPTGEGHRRVELEQLDVNLELDRHGWVQIPTLPLPSEASRHLKRGELGEETKLGGEGAAEVELEAFL